MEKIVKLTPLIYALLIFSGYLNYASYYRHFNIEIVSYLTTSELLLSFLPLTSPLLFLLLLLSIYFIVELVEIANGRSSSTSPLDDSKSPARILLFVRSYKQIRKEIKTFKWHSGSKIFSLVLEIILFLVSLASLIFFIVYAFIIFPLLVENKVISGAVLASSFPLSILWFMFLFEITMKAADKISQPVSDRVVLLVSIVSFLCLMAIFNKQQASNIIHGKPQFQVTLDLQNKIVKTDSNFLYVGKIENYFIFFDRPNSKSVLYSTSEVSTIQIIKVK